MLIILCSLFCISILSPLIYKLLKNATHLFISFLVLVIFVIFISTFGNLPPDGYTDSISIINELSINLTFYLDGLGFFFSVIVLCIGTIVIFYSGTYMKDKKNSGRYYLFIMLFLTSMLGLVISGNLITIFIFWEFTSITSFFLIGFDNENPDARKAANKALLVTAGGGLALLAGFILIYISAGTFNIPELFAKRENIIFGDNYFLILIFISLGCFTKSAQMPFHFWLPDAMVAPTPVSAFLHSATMVQAGIFVLLRLFPLLGDTPDWNLILCTFGAITLFIASFISISRTDLKSMLAYSTIASLGTMVYLIGIGTTYSIFAALVYLFAHSLYKSALFLNTGIIEKYTGTRDIRNLSGLYITAPALAIFSFMAALSNAGFPPFLGFASKELFFKSGLLSDTRGVILTILSIIGTVMLAGSSLLAGFKPFLGEYNKEKFYIKNSFLFPSGFLSIAGFAFVFFLPFLNQSLITPAATSALGINYYFDLSLWYGFNWILILSLITLVGGYFAYKHYKAFYFDFPKFLQKFEPSYLYEQLSKYFKKFSYLFTKSFQSGYLSRYILYILISSIILIGLALYEYSDFTLNFQSFNIDIYEVIISFVIVSAALTLIFLKSRLTSIILLGVVGYGISLIYLMYGAPDLAITQFIVETLTVIFFTLVLMKLPKISNFSSNKRRIRDFIISLIFGIAVSFMLLQISDIPYDAELTSFFSQNSLILAKGKNIVNTIIVDFRALDTFGEIIVLSVAAFGIFALLKLNSKKEL